MMKRSIRVILPYHLQKLAQVGSEVRLEIDEPFTADSLLEAIEYAFPTLRGTIRDQETKKRRPLLRYFACEQDISHDPTDVCLPDSVLSGIEPFIIWGAIAGG